MICRQARRMAKLQLLLLTLVAILALAAGKKQWMAQDKCKWRPRPMQHKSEDALYHYIIVGGGTTGLIAAYRLAQDPGIKVLVLENGEDPSTDDKLLSNLTQSLFDASYCDPLKGEECSPFSIPLHIIDTPLATAWASHSELSHHFIQGPNMFTNQKMVQYPRGRHLGGSTLVNYMVTARGAPPDFDELWTKQEGLKGWTYEDVLPFFRKVETVDATTGISGSGQPVPADEFHGTDGPICTTNPSQFWSFPIWKEIEKAAVDLGIPYTTDIQNPNAYYGVAEQTMAVCPNGKRSSAREYLTRAEAEGRVCFGDHTTCPSDKNLHVKMSSHVTRIEIEKVEDRYRAVGARVVDSKKHPYIARTSHPRHDIMTDEATKFRDPYSKWEEQPFPEGLLNSLEDSAQPGNSMKNYIRKQNALYYNKLEEDSVVYRASREVFMAAGAFVTPQLLQLSGVGPKQLLEAHKIEVKADLPVGMHLQDHDETLIIFKDKTPSPLFNTSDFNTHLGAWLMGQPSPLSSNLNLGTLDLSKAGPIDPKIGRAWPKTKSSFVPMHIDSLDSTLWRDRGKDKITPRSLADVAGWEGLLYKSWVMQAGHDCAFGKVQIKSRDPMQPPYIDGGLGGCQETYDEIAHALRTIREIMSKMPPGMEVEEMWPGVNITSDEDLQHYMEQATYSHHACCTAPMGACANPKAVTDGRGRVYFVDGLRILDMSVIPAIPHGNPWMNAAMAAEKITEHTKEDYKDVAA